jgi:hypothetical protein
MTERIVEGLNYSSREIILIELKIYNQSICFSLKYDFIKHLIFKLAFISRLLTNI